MVEIKGEWVYRSHMECLLHDDWHVLDDVSIYLCKYIYIYLNMVDLFTMYICICAWGYRY